MLQNGQTMLMGLGRELLFSLYYIFSQFLYVQIVHVVFKLRVFRLLPEAGPAQTPITPRGTWRQKKKKKPRVDRGGARSSDFPRSANVDEHPVCAEAARRRSTRAPPGLRAAAEAHPRSLEIARRPGGSPSYASLLSEHPFPAVAGGKGGGEAKQAQSFSRDSRKERVDMDDTALFAGAPSRGRRMIT